ncbi:MAG: hypothetical protein WCD45_08715 [Gallionella sp.]
MKKLFALIAIASLLSGCLFWPDDYGRGGEGGYHRDGGGRGGEGGGYRGGGEGRGRGGD